MVLWEDLFVPGAEKTDPVVLVSAWPWTTAGLDVPSAAQGPVEVVHQGCIPFLDLHSVGFVGQAEAWILVVLRRVVVVHPWARILVLQNLQWFLVVLHCSLLACWIQKTRVVAVGGWTMAVAVLHPFVARHGRVTSVGASCGSTCQDSLSFLPYRAIPFPSLATTPLDRRRLVLACFSSSFSDLFFFTFQRNFRLFPFPSRGRTPRPEKSAGSGWNHAQVWLGTSFPRPAPRRSRSRSHLCLKMAAVAVVVAPCRSCSSKCTTFPFSNPDQLAL